MSHVTKEVVCDVSGCENIAERSFNIKKVMGTTLSLKSNDIRNVHLCKEHYKQMKKETKNDIPDYLG